VSCHTTGITSRPSIVKDSSISVVSFFFNLYFTGNLDQLERDLKLSHDEADTLRDEIVMLKTRIAELEGTLMDERCAKEVKLETTIKGYKDSMQGQYLDYKLKLD